MLIESYTDWGVFVTLPVARRFNEFIQPRDTKS